VLANENPLKIDEATKLNVHEALTFLSFKQALNKMEAKRYKQ